MRILKTCFFSSISEDAVTVTETYTSLYDRDKSVIAQPEIIQKTGYYACAPLALTEIMAQNDVLMNDDIGTTFLQLWSDSGTEAIDVRDLDGVEDVICGSTNDANIPSALKLYLARLDLSGEYERKNTPNSLFFKNAMDDGKSGLYIFRVYEEGPLGGNRIVGHSVSVVGYAEIEYADENMDRYICAASGWYDDVPMYFAIDELDPAYPSPMGYWIEIGE